ncbi:hypothetical protein SLW70_09065 [Flavobacterium sp. NG2]|uniref:hypothetical protein n=1 Tax=Flavobacterium sp. NG2 TaxID=3097547 RepID=UPI002A81EC35|nr:hypothetical protein [Flavobacterium sp. NG2]WPR70099.1 hypothetical protein SLW70_09065 [Flavobacterium sp. NG2]
MKKGILLICFVFASLSMVAQDRFETAAKETVAKMNEVVSLSDIQQKQLYDLELSNNKKRAEVRKENEGNQSVIQEKMKEINVESYAATREILGAAKMKEWAEYRKQERSKK